VSKVVSGGGNKMKKLAIILVLSTLLLAGCTGPSGDSNLKQRLSNSKISMNSLSGDSFKASESEIINNEVPSLDSTSLPSGELSSSGDEELSAKLQSSLKDLGELADDELKLESDQIIGSEIPDVKNGGFT